jgi:hypothetical protein
MLPQCVLAFLLLAAFYAANAKERTLSSSDIAAIRRICRQVVGYPVVNVAQKPEEPANDACDRSETELQCGGLDG